MKSPNHSSLPDSRPNARPDARPDWPTYFMNMAYLARTRASCIRRAVGAVIVRNNHVLATGYNGAPRGLPHASEVGCLRQRLNVPSGQRHEICRGLHAEQNAIIQAARYGISIEGAYLYCTNHPCSVCLKMIIQAGITGVTYAEGYPDEMAKQIAEEANHPLTRLIDYEALRQEGQALAQDIAKRARRMQTKR